MANKETKTKSKIKKEVGTKKSNTQNNSESIVTEERYFTVQLDTFLFNAGIIGFIEVLKTAGAEKGKSKDDKKDYFIDVQNLEVSKEFLKSADLAQGYIDAVCSKFKNKTRIYNTIENIKYLINSKGIDEKIDEEKVNSAVDSQTENNTKKSSNKKKKSKLENIIESLTAASVKTGCDTLNADGIQNSIQENILKISKLNGEVSDILVLLKAILKDLEKDEIEKTLLMKNIIYTKIKLFWDGVSFLNKQNASNSVKYEFSKSFENPLKDSIKNTKVEKYNCITCGRETSKNTTTSFLSEVGVDTNRKKSAFWNQNPDSFICPICNFIYSCSPIGFIDIDGIMVFVNQNDSIESLISMNETIDFRNEGKSFKLYNTIIERALSIKTKELNSLQVVTRNEKRYSLNTIDKDILNIIKVREKELEFISKIWKYDFKNEDDYINVFDECLKNIFNNTNQWTLLFTLFKSELKSYGVLFSILKIQITQKHKVLEDTNVENKISFARFACKAGNEIRKSIIGASVEKNLSDDENKEADNKLRGLVYQLVNSVHTSNRDLFLGNITRLYTSMNIAIPSVFMNAFKSDEDFKEIGYAYLIGLKGGFYDKEENKNKKEDSK